MYQELDDEFLSQGRHQPAERCLLDAGHDGTIDLQEVETAVRSFRRKKAAGELDGWTGAGEAPPSRSLRVRSTSAQPCIVGRAELAAQRLLRGGHELEVGLVPELRLQMPTVDFPLNALRSCTGTSISSMVSSATQRAMPVSNRLHGREV